MVYANFRLKKEHCVENIGTYSKSKGNLTCNLGVIIETHSITCQHDLYPFENFKWLQNRDFNIVRRRNHNNGSWYIKTIDRQMQS